MVRERHRVGIVSVLAGFAACSVALAQSGSGTAGGTALASSDRTSVFPLIDLSLSASALMAFQDENGDPADEDVQANGEEEDGGYQDESGNDPRDFRDKLMPYYRFTELRNGLEAHEWVLFGFKAFTPRFGMTFEIPVKYVDASEAIPSRRFFKPIDGPPIPGFGGRVSPDIDAYDFGLGDIILRFFVRPESLEWKRPCTWGPRKGQQLGGGFMPLVETTLPTNTDDLLGSDSWILSPGFAIVEDTPTYGFIAAMFFYDFSTIKDSDEPYTSRFRARIFWLQPFSKPGPNLLDGLYMMPEFQPTYDLRDGRFSLWIGPEFGKIIKMDEHSTIDTISFYAKPGWGWAPDAVGGDREFSMEVGVRVAF